MKNQAVWVGTGSRRWVYINQQIALMHSSPRPPPFLSLFALAPITREGRLHRGPRGHHLFGVSCPRIQVRRRPVPHLTNSRTPLLLLFESVNLARSAVANARGAYTDYDVSELHRHSGA